MFVEKPFGDRGLQVLQQKRSQFLVQAGIFFFQQRLKKLGAVIFCLLASHDTLQSVVKIVIRYPKLKTVLKTAVMCCTLSLNEYEGCGDGRSEFRGFTWNETSSNIIK